MRESKTLGWGSLLLVSLGLIGCGRTTDFLYNVYPNLTPDVEARYHQIKELTGGDEIDILWTIDNSGSMGDEHAAVISNTSVFVSEFTKTSRTKWKMGLLSTDENENPYVGFLPTDILDYKHAAPVAAFQRAVSRLGTNGSPFEKSLTPILNNLKKYPTFLRPSSWLALIILSDEEEQSAVTVPNFLKEIAALRTSGLDKVLIYGVLATEEFRCPGGSIRYTGSKYEALINGVGKAGKLFSLCSADFGKALSDIGADIVSHAEHPRIYLDVRPDVSTLEVLYRGKKNRA